MKIAFNPYQIITRHPIGEDDEQWLSFGQLIRDFTEREENPDWVVGFVTQLVKHGTASDRFAEYRAPEEPLEEFEYWTIRGHNSTDPNSGFHDMPWYAPETVVAEEALLCSKLEGNLVEVYSGWDNLNFDNLCLIYSNGTQL